MKGISGRVRFSSTSFFLLVAFWSVAADAQVLVHFDLPAQPLAQSLNAIGTATNTEVAYSANLVAGLLAPPLKADLTVDGALRRVLVGTGLRQQHVDGHTIVISAADSSVSGLVERKLSLAKASTTDEAGDQIATPQVPPPDSTDRQPPSNTRKDDLDELVVTGTNIRGVTDSAFPMQVYTREQIDQSGAGSVAEFVRRLPQNFGDVTENTIFGVAGNSQSQNAVGGSGVDLRGLGSDATLVLIDGRRIAPGNYLGNFADVSLIPLSAVERIEVIPDGASAIYGSDAVGGVINFIMRRDFDGAETRVRYGAVEDGGHREISAGQTVGRNWDGGSALVSYEYSDKTPLSAADRSYSMSAQQPFNLLPEQVRNSVIFTADQAISSGIAAFADASFSRRSSRDDVSLFDTYSQHSPSDSSSYGGTLGVRIGLLGRSQLEVSGTYAASDTKIETIDVPSETVLAKSKTFDTTSSLDTKLDGTLWTPKAGAIRYAVGGQARHESFSFDQPVVPTPAIFRASRNIIAAFGELRIPIIGASHLNTSESRLEATLADRDEHYSDFGSSNNPQIGLIWRPISDLKLHAVYGKSFKAPFLNDLYTPINLDLAVPNPDPLKAGSCVPLDPSMQGACTNILLVGGGNPALRAQKATTWTLGLDFQPANIPTLRASANYYHIAFKDRIENPSSEVNTFSALGSASFLGPQIVQRNPPPAVLQGYLANPLFANPLNLTVSTISVLVDSRVQNLSSVSTSGIDFSVSGEASTPFGKLATGIDATYILKFDNQFSAFSPVTSLLNTPYNPVDLKARGHLALTRGVMNYALFVNYVNSYEDNRSTVVVPIASWTTFDASTGYQVGPHSGALSNVSATFTVTNLANKAPPYVANSFSFPVFFDGANASALGRFFSIQLSKRL